MYTLKNVTKDYPKGRDVVHALRGVHLQIKDCERLALDGRDLSKLSEGPMTKVRASSIGFIFQTFNLIPTLSAQENVETALVPLGISNSSRKSRAAEALASVGLAARARHLPSELSGGQQQRVAIARALVK